MFLARGDGIEGRPDGGAVGGVLVARRDGSGWSGH
jgi:hypothetical protein